MCGKDEWRICVMRRNTKDCRLRQDKNRGLGDPAGLHLHRLITRPCSPHLYHKPLSRVHPARDTLGRPVRILQRIYASQKESNAFFYITRHVVACFVIKHKQLNTAWAKLSGIIVTRGSPVPRAERSVLSAVRGWYREYKPLRVDLAL